MHLYEKSGGTIYSKQTDVTATSFGDIIAQSPAAGSLYVTGITVSPSAITNTMNIGKLADGDLLKNITWGSIVDMSAVFNFSSCPIILRNGETLKGKVSAGTFYVSVRGYTIS